MAKARAPPISAVITPTFSVFQIDSMVSGLSNTLLKWTQAVLAFMSNSASKSLMNRNLRNAAMTSARVGSTTTMNR